MRINKKITAVLIVAGFAGVFLFLVSLGAARAVTDHKNYSLSDAVVISIKNNSGKTICFSSCYPYYLERDLSEWDPYSYGECHKENASNWCVGADELKKFKLSIDYAVAGVHRLKIPACVGCAVGEAFRTDSVIYSNNFEIQ